MRERVEKRLEDLRAGREALQRDLVAQNGAIWVLEALLQEDGANGDSQADAG